MSRITQFIACFGWVLMAVERFSGMVETDHMWIWWVVGGAWTLMAILVGIGGRQAA